MQPTNVEVTRSISFVSKKCIALLLVLTASAFVLVFPNQTAIDVCKSIAEVKVGVNGRPNPRRREPGAPWGTMQQFCSPRSDSVSSYSELARKPDITGKESFNDGIPTFIHELEGGGSGFFICLIEKSGSSVVKHALNITFGFGGKTNVHQMPNPNSRLTADELANLFGKSVHLVPRFVVTRNPYTRLLSAYNDKYNDNYPYAKQIRIRPFPGTKQNFTFAMLIKNMHELWRAKGDAYLATLDPHFRPVHMSHCGFSYGLTYDFRLPLEKLQTWADDFAKYTNLSAKSLEILERTDPEGFDPHNYDSDSMLNDVYTEEMKKMTLEMFRKDFKQLGYPEQFPNETDSMYNYKYNTSEIRPFTPLETAC